MDHRSTLIRSVEIPDTLPPMNTLTELKGSLILKEVSAENEGIRIEGDLLWRGYFEESDECLWEGAEYFSETIPTSSLRNAPRDNITPEILSLKGESITDSIYRLTFDIRWFEEEEKEEIEVMAEPTPRAKERSEETAPREEVKFTLEEKLERIDETWRETAKTLNDICPEEQKTEEETKEEPKTCPYSGYCLRYYRTREGDELERIAEKFSATVAKLKEFNRLDSAELSTGRMLRIP
ncbi:MAG: LysM peptidoglycan-binding domain-containing protein [Firmicutes bacterium]|nr:LysM peptidoglycan-binding domain-containing protein [Bacillota bacterium]